MEFLAVIIVIAVLVMPIVSIVMAANASSKVGRLRIEMKRLNWDIAQLKHPPQKSTQKVDLRSFETDQNFDETPEVLEAQEPAMEMFGPVQAVVESEVITSDETATIQDESEVGTEISQDRLSGLESIVGRRFATWLGVLALFVGAGFFIKWAVDHGLLVPWARVGLGAAFGVAMSVVGERFMRRDMANLGQGLVGGGFAVVYLSIWASFGLYDLVTEEATFILMSLVTITGMGFAVWKNAIAISTISTLGALFTPMLLWSGFSNRDSLFAYLLIIDLGVLGVSFFKHWHLLNRIAFIGTWIYFTVFRATAFSSADVFPATAWLLVFFSLFLVLPIMNLRKRIPMSGVGFTLAMSNAVAAVTHAYYILEGSHNTALGMIALAMSAAYLALGSLTRKLIPSDERGVFGFVALSMTLLTMSIAILFDLNAVTAAWSLEACLLVYLGYKYKYLPARIGGFLALSLGVLRVFIYGPWFAGAPVETFVPFFNTDFATSMLVVVCGFVFCAIHNRAKGEATWETGLKQFVYVCTSFLGLTLASFEFSGWATVHGNSFMFRSFLPMIWMLGFGALTYVGARWNSIVSRVSGVACLFVAILCALIGYFFKLPSENLYIVNWRFALSCVVICTLFLYRWISTKFDTRFTKAESDFSILAIGLGISLSTILLQVELSGWFGATNIEIVSSSILPIITVGGALAFLVAGTKLRSLSLRVFPFALLAIASIQVSINYVIAAAPDLYFGNSRFFAAVAVIVMLFVYRKFQANHSSIFAHEEKRFSIVAIGLGISLATVLAYTEMYLWIDAGGSKFVSVSILPAFIVVGAFAYMKIGLKLHSPWLRRAGAAFLYVSSMLVFSRYISKEATSLLFINSRFLAGAATTLMFAFFAYELRLNIKKKPKLDPSHIVIFSSVFVGTLFLALSAEVFTFFRTAELGLDKHLTAQAALSVLWSLYASAILAYGFIRKIRAYRLAGLALFGATALKLAFIDLSKLQDGYRIISFIVLGLLLIGASYLYHRVEKNQLQSASE